MIFNPRLRNRIVIAFSKAVNSLRNKKLHVEIHNNASIAYYAEYNKIVRDYYLYCINQIVDQLNISTHCNIIFGHYKWTFPNKHKTIRIEFQYEHTLVKPGGRHTIGAMKGVIPVSNTENETYLVRISNYTKLLTADIIVDYSLPNIINITSSKKYTRLHTKLFHFWPLLYKYIKDEINYQERDLSLITMFGNPDEPYRKNFINTLHIHGIYPININNTFDNVESLYRRTKILINIRQTDSHHTIEELRILPALLCKTIVISEIGPLQDSIRYNESILWASLDDMPSLIKDVVNNYDVYYNIVFGSNRFSHIVDKLSNDNKVTVQNIITHINHLL